MESTPTLQVTAACLHLSVNWLRAGTLLPETVGFVGTTCLPGALTPVFFTFPSPVVVKFFIRFFRGKFYLLPT